MALLFYLSLLEAADANFADLKKNKKNSSSYGNPEQVSTFAADNDIRYFHKYASPLTHF